MRESDSPPPIGAGGHGSTDPFMMPIPEPTRAGEPYRNVDTGALGVVLSTGEFQITVTDLEIPGRGFPFRLNRTYRSKRDFESSVLGFNWHLSYDEYLTPVGFVDPASVPHPALEWTMEDGKRDRWVDWDGSGYYQPFNGFFGKIRWLGSGLGWQIRYSDGTVKTFGRYEVGPNDMYIWALTRIEDRNGNVLTIQISSATGLIDTVTDTLGRKLTFVHDGNGRLTSVTDFMTRSVVYAYDGSGNLASVRSPVVTGTPTGNDFPAGKTVTYAYNNITGCSEGTALSHNLISISDGKGQAFLTNTYYASSDARCGQAGSLFPDYVAMQVYGDPVLQQRVSYSYESLTYQTAPTANEPTFRTTLSDRNGNEQVHEFNGQGNPLRIEHRTNRGVRALGGADEADYVETYNYIDNGGGDMPMLVSQRTESGGNNVDANGNLSPYSGGMTVQYNYDQSNTDPFQRGNLLSVIQTPGPRGAPAGQERIVTSYTYEPLFNQPRTITDPRGHVTTFTYDYQEGSYAQLVAGSPPPAPVNPVWQWVGDNKIQQFMAVAGNANLTDLNGDLYHRQGNLIRVADGQATAADGTTKGPIASLVAYNNFGLPTIRRDAEFNETHFLYFSEKDPDGDNSNTPTPPDNRSLNTVQGSAGGGYLKQRILDATPDPSVPVSSPSPRESGQNPPPQNVASSYTYDKVGNVKSLTDGRGIRADYSVNALNQIVQVTHAAASTAPNAPAFGYRERFFYDSNNNVVQHRTERRDDDSTAQVNRWITLDTTYDTLDRKISETVTTDDATPISLTTAYAYDGNGNLTRTVFPAGNVVLRTYDERDLLYRQAVLEHCTGPSCDTVEPAVDSVTQYDYDGSGNLIQLTDPEGHVARMGYDGYNRKVVGFDPALQKSTYAYDPGGRILEQASFGSLGGPTPAGPPAGGYPELSRQRAYYDELGRVRRTDTKFFKYVGTLQTLLTTDSNAGLTGPLPDPAPAAGDGWVTSVVQYDRLGRIVWTTDDNAHATETRYDGLGRKLKVFLNPVAPFTDASGTSSDERNAVEYQYDADNNLTRTIETERGLDRSGGAARKLATSQKYQTDFQYDSMNRLVETKVVGKVGSTPLNFLTTVVYDSRGNKVRITDPAGGRTKSTYDGLNRILKIEAGYVWTRPSGPEIIPANMVTPGNPDGKVTTSYTYDADGRLTSIVDDNSRTTSLAYDNLNRQTRITYPDNTYKEITYNRDSLGIVWDHFKGNGAPDRLRVATQYDALHRSIRKDIDNSLAIYFVGTKRQLFEFDGAGRMTWAVDDQDPADAPGLLDSQVRMTYDSLGKVLSEDEIYGEMVGGSVSYTTNVVTSLHDGVGFRTRMSYPGVGARSITFTADELNRLDTLNDSFTGTTKYDYLGPSRVLNRLYPNTTKLTMLSGPSDNVGAGYDDARRVVDWANKGGTPPPNVPPEFTYAYDAANNRLFERRVHQPSAGNWKGERYGYDAMYRLINRTEADLNASGALVGTPPPTQTFTLDGLGNWNSYTKDGTAYTNSVNALNQYTQFQGAQGTRNLSYDFAGNVTSEGTGGAAYGYDFANRLVTFRSPAGTVTTYRYDALGRRIARSVGGTSLTRFIYDGDRLIEERDGSNLLVTSYAFGIGSNEALTRRRWTGGVASDLFYHTNALGSVTAVTDTSGAVIERYQYDAYGKPTFLAPDFTALPSSIVFNAILFTGQYFDVGSGNYHYRARYYNPYLGRFLQRDPLGESASLNLYAYVRDNPVNGTDPSGMLPGGRLGSYMRANYAGLEGHGNNQAKMQFRGGHYVDYHNAEFSSFEEAQDAEDHYAELEREQAAWDDKRARVAAHTLKGELKESLSKFKGNLADVSHVDLIFYGFLQNAAAEHAAAEQGDVGKTQLDDLATKLASDKNTLVLEINADNVFTALGITNDPSPSAMQFLTGAVTQLLGMTNNAEVNMIAFSLGGGPTVALTNGLTGAGVSGGRIHDYLVDAYYGNESNHIADPKVGVSLYYAGHQGVVAALARAGRFDQAVSQRGFSQLSGTFCNACTHTQMDSFNPGVLGQVYQAVTGNPWSYP